MTAIVTAYRGGSTRTAAPGWWVSFTYSEDLISALKARIPASGREWNQERSAWWVAQEHEATLVALLPAMESYIAQPQLF